jgi:peptide deformylase
MALLEIIEAPHPTLTTKARRVRDDEFGDALARLFEDMAETMYAAPGVGLAAPQIDDSRRILVADPGFEGEDGEAKKGIDLVYMVNPELLERSKERIKWMESCLSIPDYSQEVQRSKRIVVRYQDAQGNEHQRTYEGFPAVVIQHEIDHLDGVTLLRHSSRFKRNRYLQRVQKKAAKRSN